METPQSQSREYVWQGRLWPNLAAILVVLVVVFAVFIGGAISERGEHARSLGQTLLLGSVAFVPLVLIFGFALAGTPRRLAACKEGLVLERWGFGTRRLSRAEIAGVRPSVGRRGSCTSIRVERIGSSRSLLILDCESSLGVRPEDLLRSLDELYGPTRSEIRLREAAQSIEAARLSQESTRWRARPYPKGLVVDVVSLAASALAVMFWKPLWAYMANADRIPSLTVFLGLCVVLLFAMLAALGVIRGGRASELVIDSSGVTVVRRWRSIKIRAEEILGARQDVFFTSRKPGVLSRAVLARPGRRRSIWLREEFFDVPAQGLLAGILLHRFGELIPPNTSRPPAV